MKRGLSKFFSHPFWDDESGAPVVEFAIVAPFLVLVTVGIIDIGRAVWTWTTIEHVAREATRYAAVRGADHVSPATEASVQTFAENQATGLSASDLTVTVTWDGNSNAAGSKVTVVVDFDFDLLLSGFISQGTISLSGNSTMVIL